ncbi:MAG: AraC family transcriptional regulator [Synoicihabitans sp.]
MSKQVLQARRFFLEAGMRDQAPLSVVCVGWEKCSRDYLIHRKTFPFLSLEFVAAGRGHLEINGVSHELKAGSLFTYGPDVHYRMETDPTDLLDKYFVDIVGPKAPTLMKELDLQPGSLHHYQHGHDIKDAFEHLLRLAGHVGVYTTRSCALQLELLLLSTRYGGGETTTGPNRAFSTFERCRRHMEDHFLQYSTVEDFADACHINLSYLCRLYRKFSGVSPYQYLMQVKMKWAANRLHGGEILVREVADELGIDQFQFSRAFKRVHGVSPAAFIKLRGG